MSKPMTNLKQAIHNLNIKKPFDLSGQSSPGLRAPVRFEQPQVEPTQIRDGQIEQPQVEVIQKRQAPQGFFMLAHSIFENEIMRGLSGDAFRIFIWMSAQAWRFKESNGEFRGAVDFISTGCGCSRSTVSRGLQDLKKMKLIECVEQNFKRGNLWRISRIADGRLTQSEDPQNEAAQSEQPQNDQGACSNSGSSMVNLTKEHGQIDHEIISSNNFKKTQHSSGPVSSEIILNYLEGIVTDKKRDSERMAMNALKEIFKLSEIEEALIHLTEQNFYFNGTRIHSPLSFLTYAMNEVLSISNRDRLKKTCRSEQLKYAQAEYNKASNDLLSIQQETATMVTEFVSSFASENDLEMKVGELVGGLPFKTKDQRVNYAAQKWWLLQDKDKAEHCGIEI